MVRTGEGISDIAYLLATSLTPEDRKTFECSLIDFYIESLSSKGIADLNPEKIRQRYRAHLIYPFEAMLISLAIGDILDITANKTLIKRTVSAIEDNHSFSEPPI